MALRSLARTLPQDWIEHALMAYLRRLGQGKRWQVAIEGAEPAAGPGLLCFWHADLLCAPALQAHFPGATALVSRSRDGGLAARAAATFGVGTVRASRAKPGKRDKGGLQALGEIAAALQAGRWVAITPDGPRGPARQCAPGIAQIARFTGAKVRAAGFAVHPCLRLNTWDKLCAPAPWASGAAVVSPALQLDRRADAAAVAAFTHSLESELEGAGRRARALLQGRST